MILKGIEKTAKSSVLENMKHFAKGVDSAAKTQTISDVLNLRGLKEISKAKDAAGGAGHYIRKGGETLWHSLGKATPSLAVAGAYGVAAKKLLEKAKSEPKPPEYLAPI